MAATGFTPIYLYASGTTGNIPSASNLTNTTNGSEIALNYFDGKLFYKNASNSVVTVPLLQSSGSQNGWLSSTDWTTFNSKQAALGYTPVNKSGDTMTGSLTALSFIPSSSTVPANGLYLPSANTFGLAANSTALASGTSTAFSVLAGKTLRLNRSDNATYNEISYGASDKFLFNQANGGTYSFAVSGTEVAGISNIGQITGVYATLSSSISGTPGIQVSNTGASYGSTLTYLTTTASASGSFDFIGAYANSVAQFRVDGAGNTITTGNFVVGTSGKGIDFSATAGTGTSELLADYEEGTFTPIAIGITVVSGTPTYTGKYTKVGRLVTIDIVMTALSGTISFVAGNSFGNLPYTSNGPSWGAYGNSGAATNGGFCVVSGASVYFATPNTYANYFSLTATYSV